MELDLESINVTDEWVAPPNNTAIMVALWSTIFAIGVPVNCIVLISILWHQKLRTVSHMYVLNLALADLLHISGLPVVLATTINGGWPEMFGIGVCKVYTFLHAMTMFASSLFLGVLSWDRYHAICHPHCTFFTRTINKAIGICACCWVIVIIEMFPVLIYSTLIENPGGTKTCIIFWGNPTNISEDSFDSSRTTFTLYSSFAGYLLPLFAIWIFYANILHKMWVKRAHILGRNRLRNNIRVTLFCLVIVMTYSLLWLPFWIVQWSIIFQAQSVHFSTLALLAYLLQEVNGVINPFLYGLMTDAFRKLFCRRKYELRVLSRSDDHIRTTACDFSTTQTKKLNGKRKITRNTRRTLNGPQVGDHKKKILNFNRAGRWHSLVDSAYRRHGMKNEDTVTDNLRPFNGLTNIQQTNGHISVVDHRL